ECQVGIEAPARGPAARDVDEHALDGDVAHALGGVNGGADRPLGLVHVDHGAVLDAAGQLMAHADHLQLTVLAGDIGLADVDHPGDQAADFGGADIECRNDRGTGTGSGATVAGALAQRHDIHGLNSLVTNYPFLDLAAAFAAAFAFSRRRSAASSDNCIVT